MCLGIPMQITEIYQSISGESQHAGRPCTLVRTTGCDLRCTWCDTAYAFTGGTAMGLDEIVRAVSKLTPRLVLLTGGEPMLQQETPQDFVVGTGQTHTVRQFCEAAFDAVSLEYQNYIVQDERFYRPAEVDLLIADPSKAKEFLGWQPKVSFDELVKMMVDADLARVGKELG